MITRRFRDPDGPRVPTANINVEDEHPATAVTESQAPESVVAAIAAVNAQEHRIHDLADETLILNDNSAVNNCTVLRFLDNNKCVFELGPDLGPLTKIFLEGNVACQFRVRCKILSSHIEVSHCQDLQVDIANLVHTIQIDLCDLVRVKCDVECCSKVYHAGSTRIKVCNTSQCVDLDDFEIAGSSNAAAQFVTSFLGADKGFATSPIDTQNYTSRDDDSPAKRSRVEAHDEKEAKKPST